MTSWSGGSKHELKMYFFYLLIKSIKKTLSKIDNIAK